MYDNILVAVDGSDASRKAFETAINIAKHHQPQLIITHVIDSRAFATAEIYDRTLAERSREDAEELIAEYVDQALGNGVNDVKPLIKYGSPKTLIAKDIAKDIQADLIISGATGVSAVERLLIGSVSEKITKHASCDVLVVR